MRKEDPKYEKHRKEAREYRSREEAIWRFREQETALRNDRLFTPDEVQAVYDEALKVMTYPPGAKADDDLERATTAEIEHAEDLIFTARLDKENAWIRARQERAAQQIMNPKEH